MTPEPLTAEQVLRQASYRELVAAASDLSDLMTAVPSMDLSNDPPTLVRQLLLLLICEKERSARLIAMLERA